MVLEGFGSIFGVPFGTGGKNGFLINSRRALALGMAEGAQESSERQENLGIPCLLEHFGCSLGPLLAPALRPGPATHFFRRAFFFPSSLFPLGKWFHMGKPELVNPLNPH